MQQRLSELRSDLIMTTVAQDQDHVIGARQKNRGKAIYTESEVDEMDTAITLCHDM